MELHYSRASALLVAGGDRRALAYGISGSQAAVRIDNLSVYTEKEVPGNYGENAFEAAWKADVVQKFEF